MSRRSDQRLDELFKRYPEHLTVTQLAEVLGMNRQTIYNWLNAGKLPAYRQNDRWVILRDEVRDWLREGRNEPSASDG